jgi:hypothetical protein
LLRCLQGQSPIINEAQFAGLFKLVDSDSLRVRCLIFSVENLKLFIEMAHGKQASDKLFNEINWLIVHSLKAGYSVYILSVICKGRLF